MVAALLAATFAASGSVQLELPPELVLQPLALEELAGNTAIAWDGTPVPALALAVRRVPGAFRVLLPRGVPPSSLQVVAEVRGLGNPEKKGNRVPVKVTALSWRFVEWRGETEVWEADLLLHLDLSRAAAGTLQGTLEVSVVGR